MRKVIITLSFLLLIVPCFAHGFGGTGLLHPLTGPDHFLAMVAIGAWSAQLGGRNIYVIPFFFLAAMVAGGVIAVNGLLISFSEEMIVSSLLFLGIAIAMNKKIAFLPAFMAVCLFGFSHGYSHGSEIPAHLSRAEYFTGFLLTTAGLHLIGAIGGLLLLEERNGKKILRGFGLVTFTIGLLLAVKFIF